MYIVFEGIVGAGKSTQVKKLVAYLQSTIASGAWQTTYEKDSLLYFGLSSRERVSDRDPALQGQKPHILHIREPGSTPIAEDIRHLAQAKDWQNDTMHPLTNAYLYASARAQTLHTVVKPALEAGNIVIADRSFLSSCAIQGEAQGLGINTILSLNTDAVADILPDIIFYLDIDVDTALSRVSDQRGDKFEREGREFYQKIVRGYEKCEKLEIIKNRFIRIDANGTEDEVFEKILKELTMNK